MEINQIKKKVFADLGVQNPTPELEEKMQDYLFRIVLEIVLRRADDAGVEIIEQALASDDERQVEEAFAAVSASIPGLAEEIEEALKAEYESLKAFMN